MRYDYEFVIAQAFKDYLDSVLSDDFKSVCPVVTFFDPMSIPGPVGDGSAPPMDTQNRVVIFGSHGETDPSSPAHTAVFAEVELRSRWTQADLAINVSDHRDRLNTLCALLFLTSAAGGNNLDGLLALLAAKADTNVGIEKVQPRVPFDTMINDNHWILSRRHFEVKCFAQDIGS